MLASEGEGGGRIGQFWRVKEEGGKWEEGLRCQRKGARRNIGGKNGRCIMGNALDLIEEMVASLILCSFSTWCGQA